MVTDHGMRGTPPAQRLAKDLEQAREMLPREAAGPDNGNASGLIHPLLTAAQAVFDVPLHRVKQPPSEATGILPSQEEHKGDHMLGHQPRRPRTGIHAGEGLFLLVAAGGPRVPREDRVDGPFDPRTSSAR
jgi:hypothetical protein